MAKKGGSDMSMLEEITVPVHENHPLYDAVQLTRGGTQARIRLDDKVYTLRITRAGKLILTK